MNKEQYIKEVLRLVDANPKIRNRIKEDLNERIDAAMDADPYFNIIEEMGEPTELAKEFSENLDNPDGMEYSSVNPIVHSMMTSRYEYKSKRTLFGLPLVHINVGGRYRASVAKGIIALGDVAIGAVSLGGVSVGVVSLGGVSVGLGLALGGVAVGGVALGGVAVGLVAIGGIALSIFESIGGLPFTLK